jgi:DNA-binding NarL/FixJ family response regulator
MVAVERGADGEAVRGSVVIADDDVLLREGLASLLDRAGFAVVGQAGDAAELVGLVREQQPNLAIIDIRMPPSHTTEGLDAARAIREETPETAVLVLSAHAEVEHAMDLLASGERSGYLLKSRVTDVDEFLDTLDRILKGGSAVDPALVQELVAARRVRDPLADLSPREREVLELMAEGRSNAGIAHRLWVTEGTVEKHVHRVLGKLRLPETTEDHRRVLAVIAYLESR